MLMLAALAATCGGLEAFGQSTRPPGNSAQSSPNSATRAERSAGTIAVEPGENGVGDDRHVPPASPRYAAACNAAAEELRAARRLIELLDRENALLRDRLETEKRAASLLAELNGSRRAETDALREAVAAKNEALMAKDAVIASQGKLIDTLKTRRSSPWKRLGDILIGVAAGMVLK